MTEPNTDDLRERGRQYVDYAATLGKPWDEGQRNTALLIGEMLIDAADEIDALREQIADAAHIHGLNVDTARIAIARAERAEAVIEDLRGLSSQYDDDTQEYWVSVNDIEMILARVSQPASEIVCICGSTRFRDEMTDANRRLTLAGRIVVAPGVFGHSGDAMTDEQKVALDALHFRKIDLAQSIYVVNPGGYIGESTAREIAYAERTGKPVTYLVEPASEVEQ